MTLDGTKILEEHKIFDLDTYKGKLEFLHEFQTRTDACALQMDNGSYLKRVDDVDIFDYMRHIEGTVTMGFYQLFDGMVNWVCYDLDTHGDECHVQTMTEAINLCKHLDDLSIPYVLEESGTPYSFHIWIMLVPVEVSKAFHWSRELIKDLDIDCEVFPKQSEPKEYGNLVKLPLAYNRKVERWSRITNANKGIIEVRRVDIGEYDISSCTNELSHVHTNVGDSGYNIRYCDIQCSSMKPCFKAILEDKIQLTGTSGHRLRIALVPELRDCLGLNLQEICNHFTTQMDYDFNTTYTQVQSVFHYNRSRCQSIKGHVNNKLGNEICKGCIYDGL